MDQVVSDLGHIRENYLIHFATKINFQLLFSQLKDCLHTIFRPRNQSWPLCDMFEVRQMVNKLRNPNFIGSDWRPRLKLHPTFSEFFLWNHACFGKFIMEKSSGIIFLFDGDWIANRCYPRITTPFNALFSGDVSFFTEIINKRPDKW